MSCSWLLQLCSICHATEQWLLSLCSVCRSVATLLCVFVLVVPGKYLHVCLFAIVFFIILYPIHTNSLESDQEWNYQGFCSDFGLKHATLRNNSFSLQFSLLSLPCFSLSLCCSDSLFSFSLSLSSWENSKGSEGSRWSYVWRHPLSLSTHPGICTWHDYRDDFFSLKVLYTPWHKVLPCALLFFVKKVFFYKYMHKIWVKTYFVLHCDFRNWNWSF